MKNLNFKILYLLSILVLSCSNNDENGGVNLTISASNSSASKLTSGIKTSNAEVVFTDFKISIRDVVFKNDDDIAVLIQMKFNLEVHTKLIYWIIQMPYLKP